jgi:hypothetical protein
MKTSTVAALVAVMALIATILTFIWAFTADGWVDFLAWGCLMVSWGIALRYAPHLGRVLRDMGSRQ